MKYERIHVCGTSGSGKTTIAARLAKAMDGDHIEIDSLWHRENWTTAPMEEFRALVDARTAADRWAADGNYFKVKDIVWSRVQLVVWLDYPLPLVLWRLTRRTFGRAFRRELLWGINRENLWTHLFVPKNSLYWWVLTTYRKRRREYKEVSSDPANRHIEFKLFKRPKDAESWLAGLEGVS
jgi:adenylate kinase family enzyme